MSATTKKRVLVGSDGGGGFQARGACSECGLIADLALAEETLACAPAFVRLRSVCLPCALGAEAVAPLPTLARAA